MSESTKKDYKAMWIELIALGYHIAIGDDYTEISIPDGTILKYNFVADTEWAIEKAYVHYQREKKFVAMESLLEEYLERGVKVETDEHGNILGKDAIRAYLEFSSKATDVLGKE